MAGNPFSGLVKGECQVCHTKVDGRSYYCAEHKPPKRSRKKEREAEPITINVSTPTRSKRGPSAETYWKVFGDVIVVLLNYWLLKPLDKIPETESIQEKLMITEDEAKTLARPFLRIFSQTSFSRANGGRIIENADVVPAGLVVMSVIEKMQTVRAIVESNQSGRTSETIQTGSRFDQDNAGFGPVLVEDLERAQSKTS